jgi:hypothetical protein
MLNPESVKCDVCDPREYRRGRKERVIRGVLEDAGLTFTYNAPLGDGCVLRPDFLFEWGVVELDEYQHTSIGYTPEGDVDRMKEIYRHLGKPTVFVRYNPDTYTTDGVVLDPSPRERHQVLIRVIRMCMEINIETLMVVYLYYDGFSGEVEFKTLDV